MTPAYPMCIPSRFFCVACLDWTGISVDQDAQDKHLTVGGPKVQLLWLATCNTTLSLLLLMLLNYKTSHVEMNESVVSFDHIW